VTYAIDRAVRDAAIRSANQHTRRGFLGRVAAMSGALVAGGAALQADPAFALCSGNSVTCNTLWGNNYCPSSTCEDGAWTVPAGNCDAIGVCGSGNTRWRDCCITGCSCHTVSGYPSCCNDCIYILNGTGGGPCASGSKVRCRYWACA
jgi:hypothetical protein